MSTQIATVSNNLPAIAQPQSQEILSTDIIIPKLLLMQGLSEFVSDKKKCPLTGKKIDTGDFVRSTTCEVVGGEEKPISFIPLKMVNGWRVLEEVAGKFEFRRTEPRTAANEMAPWEFTENGAKWKRVKTLDVFALLPQDIEAFQKELADLKDDEMPDLTKTLMPVVISFRSTSFNAGKSVATFFGQVRDMARATNRPLVPYGYSLELSTVADKNDKGNYYVFKVGKATKIPEAMKPEAQRWFENLMSLPSNEIRVDETGDDTAIPSMSSGSQF
jgi:hypothetical protein